MSDNLPTIDRIVVIGKWAVSTIVFLLMPLWMAIAIPCVVAIDFWAWLSKSVKDLHGRLWS